MGSSRVLLWMVASLLLGRSPAQPKPRAAGVANAAPRLRRCPAQPELKSVGGKSVKAVAVTLKSKASVDLGVFWASADGGVVGLRKVLPAGGTAALDSTEGHVLRLYAGSRLFLEFQVSAQEAAAVIDVMNCPGYTNRSAEFESLILQDESCTPDGKSSRWQCVQRLSKAECDMRVGKDYGFQEGETRDYMPGDVEDFKFDAQITSIPQMATGYLRMNMTEAMRKALLPAYEEQGRERARKASTVPGGFVNDAKVSMYHAPMPGSNVIRQEMAEILSWWTGMPLTYTSVFGIRVYRRGNTLVNHVDRKESHIISAVLQVAQTVDEDGGWPLEVRTDSRDCAEVYLQPGQMVLYEGGRLKHGRPMRLRGDEFANVFVHFMPVDWKWPPPPHYRQRKRWPAKGESKPEL